MTAAQMSLQQAFGATNVIENHPVVDNPQVSVIIPSFNCLIYLPKAIKSVQEQQVSDLEILIIDDGSSDDTWQYLKLAKHCDGRIKPIKLAGVGVARARNQGLKLAQGQYIAFLDADDYWLAGKLSRQLDFHDQQPQATLSFCNYRHVKENNADAGDCFSYWPSFAKRLGKYQGDVYQLLNKQGIGTIFAENVIGTSGVMLNRKALGRDVYFDETLLSAEDWDFWLRAALRGPIGFTTSIDMAYFMRPGSETSRVKLRLKYMQVIMWRYVKPVLQRSPAALLQSVSRLLVGYAEYYRCDRNHPLKPCVCHFLAFLLSPSRRLFKAMLADLRYFLSKMFFYPCGFTSSTAMLRCWPSVTKNRKPHGGTVTRRSAEEEKTKSKE
jgi:glycosyltransferase involved in cell wall biosynthesis